MNGKWDKTSNSQCELSVKKVEEVDADHKEDAVTIVNETLPCPVNNGVTKVSSGETKSSKSQDSKRKYSLHFMSFIIIIIIINIIIIIIIITVMIF